MASASAIRLPGLPITTTSSASQSTLSDAAGRGTVAPGPTIALENLPKITGRSGIVAPVSAAWAR